MKKDWRDTFSSKKAQVKQYFTSFVYVHDNEDERIDIPPDIVTDANEGDVIAQLDLEKLLIDASLSQRNHTEMFDWIYSFAKQGNMEAQFRLGELYALGHGTSKSSFGAYKWYTKAAIQGYKKALIRIHNLYQQDIKMHCRGQINSEEEEWASLDFKKENKIRELNEYRLEQKKGFLNGAISYYTKQFKLNQIADQADPSIQLNLAFLYQHGYGVKKCIKWAFEYYEMAAEQGNTDAQYNLGNLYQKHTNMKFYYRHAFKWFTESAEGGNRVAQRSLAYFYLKGLATKINDIAAYTLYTKAAEAGDTEAMVTLGKLYRKGECVKQDLQKAVHWYTCAARRGNIVAQNCLVQLYQGGILHKIKFGDDTQDYLTELSMNNRLCTHLSTDISKLRGSPDFKQLKELSKRALIGDGQAMYEIGLKYLKGDDNFAKDKDTGMKWIKNAATAKHKSARLLIAELYRKGDVVEQDYHKVAVWYRRLAKQKDAVAQCNVGDMYCEGLGVRKDPLEASKWFIWAADQGNSGAKFGLSMLKFQGIGLRQDKEEALELLTASALQKNAECCYYLGQIYLGKIYNIGIDVKRNIQLGIALLKFAAKNDSIRAQMQLANRHRYGDGVDKDMELCIQYYTMASDSGSLEAKYKLGFIYLNGSGVNCNYFKAYHLFKQAEEKGHAEAKHLFQDYDWFDFGIRNLEQRGVSRCTYPRPHISSTPGDPRVLNMFIKVTERGIDDLSYYIAFIYENRTIRSIIEPMTEAKKWYLIASAKGDTRADYRLGKMYDGGYYGTDMDVAISYYERASVNGNRAASRRLAEIYFNDDNVTRDTLKASRYYATGYVTNDLVANVILNKPRGKMSEEGYRIQTRALEKVNMAIEATENVFLQLHYQIGAWYEDREIYESAFKWFKSAAEIGVTDAYYRLGVFYEEGKGVEQDYVMAAKMYQKATEKDHENACYRLGQLYQFGNGVELDYLKAYQLYKKADNMGHTEAHKILNITLEHKVNSNKGENALEPWTQNYQDSLSMCRYVAEQGHTDVQFKVGYAYEYCVWAPNYVEAYNWYSLAAKESHREAMYHLGLLYEKGLGTRQNYQNAIQLYEQASQLGSDGALYRLGHLYHYGKGITMNLIKAVEYYTRSAELENPKGQCELGRLYEEGKIVQKNPLEALKWYTKAYVQGYDPIRPQLYFMYKDQPYEDFFPKKLFRNLSIASCGHFRLTEKYEKDIFGDLNNRLGIFCALGYGTNKNAMLAWDYFAKPYDGHYYKFRISDILEFKYDFVSMEKGNILKALAEDKGCRHRIDRRNLYALGEYLFDGVVKIRDGYISIYNYEGNDLSRDLIIEKDYPNAFKCLKQAAKERYLDAFFLLAVLYHCASGDTDQRKQQDEMGPENVANSDIKYGEHASSHICKGNQDFTKAFECYNHALYARYKLTDEFQRSSTYATIQVCLGLLYEYGDGVEKDYQKALECYKEATSEDIFVGYHRLALMYYYGKGVPVDYCESHKLFSKAAFNFSKESYTALPHVYDKNDINGNNSKNNRVYCIIDKRRLEGESYYWLGIMLKNGQGTFQDLITAQDFFKKALKHDCQRAKYEIDGYNSQISESKTKDVVAPRRWYQFWSF